MSLVTIQGNASGTGTLTIAAPNTNSNFTLTLPTATTTLVGTDATQTLTNKTLTSPTINSGTLASSTLTTPNIDSAQVATVSGTAPLYMARAWVNFDGTGTPAVRASGNVSSIGDNGVGNYTVNFSTALPDINYSAVASVTSQGSVNSNTNCVDVFASAGGTRVAPTTSAFRLFVFHPGNQAAQDALYITASVFR